MAPGGLPAKGLGGTAGIMRQHQRWQFPQAANQVGVRVGRQFLARVSSVSHANYQPATRGPALQQVRRGVAHFGHGLGIAHAGQRHRLEYQVRLWPAVLHFVAGHGGIQQQGVLPSQPREDGIHDRSAEACIQCQAHAGCLELIKRLQSMGHRLDIRSGAVKAQHPRQEICMDRSHHLRGNRPPAALAEFQQLANRQRLRQPHHRVDFGAADDRNGGQGFAQTGIDRIVIPDGRAGHI